MSTKLVPTTWYARFLRRVSPIKGKPLHDAAVMIDLVQIKGEVVSGPDASLDNHPSWPLKSIDGYVFTEEDAKLVVYVQLFENKKTKALVTLKGEPDNEILTCSGHCKCKKHK